MADDEGGGGRAGASAPKARVWGDSPFWDFSLAVHGRPGVGDACVGLQDRLGADVNILLFCCWTAATGRGRLDDDDLARLNEAAARWHRDVVQPLRAARRALKAPPRQVPRRVAEALRETVKAAELESERIEQTALAATFDRPPVSLDPARRAEDMHASLMRYVAFLGLPPPVAEDRAALDHLVAAVCHGPPDAD